ncbi:MAG: hypothetical protein VST64_00645 [Nitrospirota bacterium]|nr:hypothetical protein [Nitrospirota bacterium]
MASSHVVPGEQPKAQHSSALSPTPIHAWLLLGHAQDSLPLEDTPHHTIATAITVLPMTGVYR